MSGVTPLVLWSNEKPQPDPLIAPGVCLYR